MADKLIPVDFDLHSKRYHCAACGYSLRDYHSGRPCPKCGLTGHWCALPTGHKGDHEHGRGGVAVTRISASCKECGALIFDESGAVLATMEVDALEGWAAWAIKHMDNHTCRPIVLTHEEQKHLEQGAVNFDAAAPGVARKKK